MYIEKLNKFIDQHSKYYKWYVNLIISRQNLNRDCIVEYHHIFPRCLCITQEAKDKLNIVALTPREHFIAHLLLSRIATCEQFKRSMNNAYYMMANVNNLKYNSILYEKSKLEARKNISRKLKGLESKLKGKSYEEIHGYHKAQELKKHKSKMFKDRQFTNETIEKMKNNHVNVSNELNPNSKAGALYDNNGKKIYAFNLLNDLKNYCDNIGLPYRGLKSNNWTYNPNVTSRNKKFTQFFNYYVIFD